jgi:hypothetical protein
MWAARRICDAGLDGAGSLQELLTIECEGDAVRVPVEQFSSEFGFKGLDRRGNGRLRHVKTGRSRRNTSDFGCGDEVAHLTESQSHKKFRYQRTFFRILQLLAATQKSSASHSLAFEEAFR